MITPLDLKTPRPGPINPNTCHVCAALRALVVKAARELSADGVKIMVQAMHVHMIYGHPTDRRSVGQQ